MAALKSIIGNQFGRWTVIARDPENAIKCGNAKWICRCECGAEGSVVGSSLRNGGSTSCGCYQREVRGKMSTTHGLYRDPIYAALSKARQRCTNPKNKHYADYGGRGIKFEFNSVAEGAKWILENLGKRPDAGTLDRINNSGGYRPGNLRWATNRQQLKNRRAFKAIESFSNQELLQEIERRGILSHRPYPDGAVERWNWGEE